MPQLHETHLGGTLFNTHIPRIVRALEYLPKIVVALERIAVVIEKSNELEEDRYQGDIDYYDFHRELSEYYSTYDDGSIAVIEGCDGCTENCDECGENEFDDC